MKKIIIIFLAFLCVGIVFELFFLKQNVIAQNTNKQNSISKTDNNKKVRVGLLNSQCKPDNLPYLVAMKNGYFKNVNIEEITANNESEDWGNAELRLDKYDMIVAGRAQIYYMEATDPQKWKVFLANVNTLDKNDYAILTRNDSGINNLENLKSNLIGVDKLSGTARFVLMKMVLEGLNLNIKDYSIIDASIDDLKNKKIDVLYLREPQLSLALNSGEYKIILDAPIVNHIMSPWPQGFYAISTDFASKNKKLKEELVNALNDSVNFIDSNPVEADNILRECGKKSYGIDNLNFRDFEYWKLDKFNKEAIQKQINLYYEKQIIPKSFDVNDIILK